MKVEQGFQQTPSPIEHPYTDDLIFQSLLRKILPHDIRQTLNNELVRLGDVLVSEIRKLEPLIHPPTLVQYNHWGRRIDDLQISEGWRELEKFALKEGYVAIPYECEYGAYSRTSQFAQALVMTGDCHAVMISMAMNDAAARLVEYAGTDAMKKEVLPRLVSRDSKNAFLCGLWITERSGSSDVSLTETRATPSERLPTDLGSPYILNGVKWYASGGDRNLAVALARTGELSTGIRGLSLFLIPLRMGSYASPLSNGVRTHRLKNKIGTHAIPTAELELRGTRAWLIGPLNDGVRCIALMQNITRVHSAVHSVGSLKRCLAIARAHARVRATKAGTVLLKDVPLHVASLARVALLYRALAHVTFGVIALLGKSECGMASEEEAARLRMLTPMLKAYAAERATGGMEQALAALGGLGYMEEVGIGRLIRDAMVEKVWEGTTNICALDLARVATKDPKVVIHYLAWAHGLLAVVPPQLRRTATKALNTLSAALNKLPSYLERTAKNPLLPCPVLLHFGTVSCALYMLEHATWAYENSEPTAEVDTEAFCRWVEEDDLMKIEAEIEASHADQPSRTKMNSVLVFGNENVSAKL